MSSLWARVIVVEPTVNVFQVSPLSVEYSNDTDGAELFVAMLTVELSSRATNVRLSGTEGDRFSLKMSLMVAPDP